MHLQLEQWYLQKYLAVALRIYFKSVWQILDEPSWHFYRIGMWTENEEYMQREEKLN